MPRNPKQITKNKSKRGNNEGSIFKRNDGRWCAQVTTGYQDDGKQIRKYIYGKTRQEVAKQLSESVYTVFHQGYSGYVIDKDLTFNESLENWFETFKIPDISDSTIEKNRNFIRKHIQPAFKGVKLSGVSSVMFQKFFNQLRAKDIICLQSIKHMKHLIFQFFTYAVKEKLIPQNPIADFNIKKGVKTPKDEDQMALTGNFRTEFFKAVSEHEILSPIAIVLSFTGLRPGELIALRWSDIDFSENCISIRRSTAKTVLSTRSFAAPEIVMDTLKNWNDRQKAKEGKLQIPLTDPECYVFCTKKGTMRTYAGLRSLLRHFLSVHGWENRGIRLYTFRHTFATILLESRENPKIVSKLMGHSTVNTTLRIYSHVSDSVFKDTAKTLDKAFNDIAQKES